MQGGGGRELPKLARSKGLVSAEFVEGQHDVAEFVDKFLACVHQVECDAGRCALLWEHAQSDSKYATHVDRLFGFVRETRRRCKVCKGPVVRSWFERETVWRVYPKHAEGGPQTVAEMYLASCRPQKEELECPVCKVTTEHLCQSRPLTFPNVLLVQMVRRPGARAPVDVEEQLELPGGFPMELAGVVYHYGQTMDSGHYTCACRGPGGKYWFYDDARPVVCLQKAVAQIKPREVCFLAYCRRDGRAEWQAGSGVPSGGHETDNATGSGGGAAVGGGGSDNATGSGGGVAVGGGDAGGLRPLRVSDLIDAPMVQEYGATRIRQVLQNHAEEERRRAGASRGALLQASAGSDSRSPSGVGVPPGGVVGSGSADVGKETRDLSRPSPAVRMDAEPLMRELSGEEMERERQRVLAILDCPVVEEVAAASIASNVQCAAQAGAGAGGSEERISLDSARATEEVIKGMKAELERRGDVYAFLCGQLQELNLGEGIVRMLESSIVSRRAVHADWSIKWEGWARLVAQLLKVLAAGRADAVEEAFGYVSEAVRRFLFLAESAVNEHVAFPTDEERKEQLESEGWELRKGNVWGRGDCLADSLLQLLIVHGILPEDLNANNGLERNEACEAVRAHLCTHAHSDLRPRNLAGVENHEAYLEHDRHAAEIVSFFLTRFHGKKLKELPEGGVALFVKTRYDALPGYDVRLTVCAQRAGAAPGGPLEFTLFNWTGGGCTGYHYDLLVRRRELVGGEGKAVVELDGDGNEAESSSMSGRVGVVEKPRWEPFTPKVIDASLCQARVWNGGLGGQCEKEQEKGQQLCKSHARRHTHGLVTGDIPEAKFREFERFAKKRKRDAADGSGAGSGATGGAGEQCGEERAAAAEGKAEGQDADGRQDTRTKRVHEQSAAELRAAAAEGRAKAEKHGESGDVERTQGGGGGDVSAADWSAEAGERRDGVDDLSDGDLRRLIQEFVEGRRAIDERARNATAMSGSIAVKDDDVLQVRQAFGKEQELGVVLARLCGVVHASGAERPPEVKAKYASDFRLRVQMHRIRGGGTLGRS